MTMLQIGFLVLVFAATAMLAYGLVQFASGNATADRMKRMFGARPLLYWLYVWPLLHLPAWLCALLLKAHRSSLTRWMTRGAGRLLIWLGNRGPA